MSMVVIISLITLHVVGESVYLRIKYNYRKILFTSRISRDARQLTWVWTAVSLVQIRLASL